MTVEQAGCPICGCNRLEQFLFRARVPVHQNLVVPSREAAVGANRGDLALVRCRDCGLIFNKAFDPAKLEYGQTYDNTQTCSPYFNNYVDDIIATMVEERLVRESHIVEVGCGKGLFLRKLVEFPGAGNSGRGFDPSYEGPSNDLGGRLQFKKSFFDEERDVAADVLVCRHVIEHVPDPLGFLRSLRNASGPGTRLFLETPSVDWIFDHKAMWDFFYEHCCYFTESSLERAMTTAGFDVRSISRVFNGQYMWAEAIVAGKTPAAHRPDTGARMRHYMAYETRLLNELRQRLEAWAGKERTALWGAGAKGVTFANLVDPDARLIDCVVDLNPRKQGAFLPGSGHPIVDFKQLDNRGVTVALLMNPNYLRENKALLAEAGSSVRLEDLTDYISHELEG